MKRPRDPADRWRYAAPAIVAVVVSAVWQALTTF